VSPTVLLAQDEEVYQLFDRGEMEGQVEAVRVVRDNMTAIGKGFAFVLFKTKVRGPPPRWWGPAALRGTCPSPPVPTTGWCEAWALHIVCLHGSVTGGSTSLVGFWWRLGMAMHAHQHSGRLEAPLRLCWWWCWSRGSPPAASLGAGGRAWACTRCPRRRQPSTAGSDSQQRHTPPHTAHLNRMLTLPLQLEHARCGLHVVVRLLTRCCAVLCCDVQEAARASMVLAGTPGKGKRELRITRAKANMPSSSSGSGGRGVLRAACQCAD
jgi:hypothetical protein